MNNDLPFSYAVVRGDETLAVVPYKAIAEDWAFISKCKVVPLYDRPQPTLTDEEREAVEQVFFAKDLDRWDTLKTTTDASARAATTR